VPLAARARLALTALTVRQVLRVFKARLVLLARRALRDRLALLVPRVLLVRRVPLVLRVSVNRVLRVVPEVLLAPLVSVGRHALRALLTVKQVRQDPQVRSV